MFRLAVAVSLLISAVCAVGMRSLRLVCIVFLLSMSVSSVLCQSPTGVLPFESFSGDQFEHVNIANLNLNLTIPLVQKPGRGLPFYYGMSYDSQVWQISGSTWKRTTYPNWIYQNPRQPSYVDTHTTFSCFGDGADRYFFSSFTDGFGVTHSISLTLQTLCGISQGAVQSNDGSGLTFFAKLNTSTGRIQQVSLYDRSGNLVGAQDTNGNQITSSFSNGTTTWTDTLGTPVLVFSGAVPTYTLTYQGPSGPLSYTVQYSALTLQTHFGCSGIAEYPATSQQLVTAIQLPDGTAYNITYEPTPGFPNSVTGRIKSISTPAGGTFTYTYTGLNDGINCTDGSTMGLSRATPDGTWTYSRGGGATNIFDPQGNYSNVSFLNLYEHARQIYQGASTLLRTIFTCYNGAAYPCTTAPTLPISRITVYTQLPDSTGRQSKADTFMFSDGTPTEVDEYDFGNGAVGPLVRKTLTSYASFGGFYINDHPASITVQDASGTTVAQTNFSYDETAVIAPPGTTPQHISVTNPRGNLTTVSSLVGGTTYLTKHLTYYDTGRAQTATDENGAVTTYNYPDATSTCGNTFATSVSMPLNLSTSATWGCNGAVATSATDANGQTTNYSYSDPFWRVSSVTDPLNNVLNNTYTPAGVTAPATSESALNFNGSLSTTDVLTTFDSLGRKSLTQKRQAPGSPNFDTVSTFYDTDGRVSRITMPCVQTAGQVCPSTPATTTTYDGAGRPLVTTDGGGGTLTLSYSQNDVQQTVGPAPAGENTKSKQVEYDGLGRLTSVCEITSVSGSGNCVQSSSKTGYWTKYTYNTLGKLTGVSQNAQGTPQSRSYSYDSLGRLTSENNPETNTTQYFYDTAPSTPGTACPGTYNGDLVKKYDANGNTTCYTYDALHRVLTTTYSGPNSGNTPTKTFVYDSTTFTCPAAPHVPGNVAGRLAEAYTGSSGSKTTDVAYCYSARGEITDVYESTPHSGGYYHTTAAYWANEVPQALGGVGTQNTYTYGVDGEGRPKSATQGTTNFVSNTTYNAASQPLTVSLYNGNGDNDTYGYDPNTGRLSNYTFTVGSPAKSMSGALTWNANGTLNTLAITDGFNSSGTQTCKYGDPAATPPVPGYDDLGRLLSANCASAWSQTFAYNDPYGNITKSGSMTWNPGYNSKNQYTLAGTSYDSNGNLLTDTFHTYTWDANNHPATIDSSVCGTNGTCLSYDALGDLVEKNVSGTYSEIEYSPLGKVAVMNGTAQIQAYVPLPGGERLSPSPDTFTFWHTDWLGSVRLATSASQRTATYDRAFAPFGEVYNTVIGGTANPNFTGDTQDTVAGEYDTPNRELHPSQGRWISPDPAGWQAADLASPQSWNRYAYAVNNPCSLVDPLGLLPQFDCTLSVAFPGQKASDVSRALKDAVSQILNKAGVDVNFVDSAADMNVDLNATVPQPSNPSLVTLGRDNDLGSTAAIDQSAFARKAIFDMLGFTHTLHSLTLIDTTSDVETAMGVVTAHELGHFLLQCTHGGVSDCGNAGLMGSGNTPGHSVPLSTYDTNNTNWQFTRKQAEKIHAKCIELRILALPLNPRKFDFPLFWFDLQRLPDHWE